MLPPELTDQVIDYLQEDKKALSKCGRVAKSWVTRSRIHLWRKVILDCAYEPTSKLSLFLDIIRDSPEAAIRIEQLELSLLDSPLCDNVVLKLSLLSSLKALSLTSCSFARKFSPEGTLSTTVRTLALARMKFSDVFAWHRFVTAFPNLQDLVLGESMQITRRVSRTPELPSKIRLRRLEMNFNDISEGFCAWSCAGIESVTTLRLDPGATLDFTTLFAFWIDTPYGAEHLELAMDGSVRPQGILTVNLLVRMLNIKEALKTVTIYVVALDMPSCLRTLFRLYDRDSGTVRLDELVFVCQSDDKDSQKIGEYWKIHGELLEEMVKASAMDVDLVTLRVTHPLRWDVHLLAGVALMNKLLPLRLEHLEEDGTISQYCWDGDIIADDASEEAGLSD